ncbi:major facilitator superfamily domain-containing protein [Mycena albidolilacea]|uniref:Major facilitator superfamily domain-containing protein n=1 Tax=Mycena albidolilacea TaxID=1033008 RepID=A0AAD6ZY70_9AGAR|nr:major facilitator superfamily domain-containing protein [Mycena albidolilacea]
MSTHSGYRRLRALSEPTTDDAVDPSPEIVQTQRAEITTSYGKHAKWALFISLGLAAYIYSLDSTTTYTFLTYATSEFKSHSLLGSIQVAQGIIIAVGKPVIAKIADVGSRGTAYFGVLIFYVVGYTVIATAQSIQAVFAGVLLYAIGSTGVQLLTQVVIADITTLKWRGLVLSLNSVPFLINAFVGSNISAAIIECAGWRQGYGLFAILIPVGLSPLIITLFWSERITRRKRQTHARGGPKKTYAQRLLDTAEELDAVGLLLIGASISLTLLPISLAKHTENWRDATGMLAIFVLGLLFIPVFALWNFRWANYPVIPFRFVVNRSVIGASLIGAFDFLAFYLTYTYLFSFVVVVKGWKLINTTYFMQLQSIAMTLGGILTGIYMHRFRRYKMLLVSGLVIRLLGVGIMLHSCGPDGSDLALVMTQVLQGIGGGIAALSIQVSSQASVLHGDVAMVTAVVLLITEFGGAGGGAIAGAIWSSEMPSKLTQHLPFLSQAERDKLFGSITEAASKPRGDPVREGVISAYGDVMKTMVFTGIVVSVLPILVASVMPDLYLGDETAAGEDSEAQVAAEDSDDDENE